MIATSGTTSGSTSSTRKRQREKGKEKESQSIRKKKKTTKKRVDNQNVNESKGSFRVNSQRLFLTYPQCGMDPLEMLSKLKETRLLTSNPIQEYIVAKELHQVLTFG
jgi:hypothetical protein